MRADAERVGNRIHLRVDDYLAGLKAEIPGAGWSKTAEAWTFPLSMDVCRNLREYFGSSLRVGRALAEWARVAIAEEQSQVALNETLDAVPLARIAPTSPLGLALATRPYQTSAARFIAEGRGVLIADTPGLGKTTEAIAGIVESGVEGPYLIVAPVSALEGWRREITARWPEASPVVVQGTRSKRNRILEEVWSDYDFRTLFIITNIEMARTKSWWDCPRCGSSWVASEKPKSAVVDCGHESERVRVRHEHEYPQLFNITWGAIIADESHRSLLRTSGTPTQTRAGMKMLPAAPDALRIAMSGTPMRGRPQRLFGTLQWIRPKEYTGFWQWVERFWNVTQSGYGGAREIGDFNDFREGSFNTSLAKVMLRRTKLEVSPELPPKAYMGTHLTPGDATSPVAVWLDMTPKQEKAYGEMVKSGSSEVDGGMLDAVGVLSEMTRMKQFASAYGSFDGRKYHPVLPSNKFDWIEQFLLDRSIIDADDDATGKVVIVSQFTEILNLYARELTQKYGMPYAIVTGEVTGSRRQAEIDTFNDRDIDTNVMFLNIMAGGVAITLDAADDMILIDETHVPDDSEQVEDRINNRRPEERVAQRNYWYLKSKGTIEEAIAAVNANRAAEQRGHLDARRGVEYIRDVVEYHANLRRTK